MAVVIKRGHFACPTSGTSVITHGLGAEPQLILFFSEANYAGIDGVPQINSNHITMGAASKHTGSWTNYSQSAANRQATAPTQCRKNFSTSDCFHMLQSATAATFVEGYVSASSSTTFTVSYHKHDIYANSWYIQWIAFAGLSDYFMEYLSSPYSTGNQDYTSAGFQPDALITVGTGCASNPGGSYSGINNIGSNPLWGIGFFDGTNQWASSGWYEHNVNPSDCGRLQSASYFVQGYFNGAVWERASAVSMLSTGYRLNWASVQGSWQLHPIVISLKGVNAHVGNGTTKSGSTGTKAYTGTGFQPECVIHASAITPALNSHYVNEFLVLGGSTSADSKNGSVCHGSADAVTYTTNARGGDTASIISCNSSAGVIYEAQVSSYDSNGFTYNFTNVDPSAWYFGYLALASGAAEVAADFQEDAEADESQAATLSANASATAAADLAEAEQAQAALAAQTIDDAETADSQAATATKAAQTADQADLADSTDGAALNPADTTDAAEASSSDQGTAAAIAETAEPAELSDSEAGQAAQASQTADAAEVSGSQAAISAAVAQTADQADLDDTTDGAVLNPATATDAAEASSSDQAAIAANADTTDAVDVDDAQAAQLDAQASTSDQADADATIAGGIMVAAQVQEGIAGDVAQTAQSSQAAAQAEAAEVSAALMAAAGAFASQAEVAELSTMFDFIGSGIGNWSTEVSVADLTATVAALFSSVQDDAEVGAEFAAAVTKADSVDGPVQASGSMQARAVALSVIVEAAIASGTFTSGEQFFAWFARINRLLN